jgi:hypothetical protein
MRAERLTAQLLTGTPAPDAPSAVRRILAVQAQDPRGARLAVRARSSTDSADAIERALTNDRSLVISWLNRGTLHLVTSDDYPWLHSLTTPPLFTGNATRLAQEGVSPSAAERGVSMIERALSADGPLTRDQLAERLTSANLPTHGQALVHVLVLATLRGLIVRGPMIGRSQAFVLVRDWLGEPKPVDREVALAELALRYLAGHGPADDRDLSKWSGLPLRDARAALRSVRPKLVDCPDGRVDLARRSALGPIPAPRLLGALLLGWRSREWVIESGAGLVTTNGVLRPFALVGGRAVATWTLAGNAVVLKPFAAVSPSDVDALAVEATAVTRYLGLSPGTPMRLQSETTE